MGIIYYTKKRKCSFCQKDCWTYGPHGAFGLFTCNACNEKANARLSAYEKREIYLAGGPYREHEISPPRCPLCGDLMEDEKSISREKCESCFHKEWDKYNKDIEEISKKYDL